MSSVRIRIPSHLVPIVNKALEDAALNDVALASSFDVCYEQSGEPWFKEAADQERAEAAALRRISDRLFALLDARRRP